MRPSHIRPLAVCVFRHRQRGNRILVEEGRDRVKRQRFFRPLGGGIEFGEPARTAVEREIREELAAAITNVRLLGVLENIFTFEGTPGHEIVFVFEADFADLSLYDRPAIVHQEALDKRIRAVWKPLTDFGPSRPNAPPLYPDGLLELLMRRP
jgi:ADP-ribose pyrophosphatase YjhB (NUDIX family)